MYNNNFVSMYIIIIIIFSLVAPKGGCPSPRAYGAYPPPTSPVCMNHLSHSH